MTISEQHPTGSGFGAMSTADDVLAGIDLSGHVALVTGGYSGLGLETVKALSAAGAHVIAPARNPEAAQAALGGVRNVTVVDGPDLRDLGSVARAADAIGRVTDRIDVLIAAAGVMATPRRPLGPGWDFQFTVNHLGHFALVTRLYPLLSVVGARVVVYSSAGHHASDIRWDDLHFLTGYDKWAAYGQSKTANILFAVHLDRLGQSDGVRAFALHPGKILTGLQREVSAAEQQELGWIDQTGAAGDGFKTTSQGAATALWAATSRALDHRGGLYLEDCDIAHVAGHDDPIEEGGVKPYAVDQNAAARLWQLSSALTACGIHR